MNKKTKKWYDNWEAGMRIDRETGETVHYVRLPNSRSDCTITEFAEGDKNWEKMLRLHSFAESALTELPKIKWCKPGGHQMRAVLNKYEWKCQRCGFAISSHLMKQIVDKEFITDKDRE